MEEAKPLSVHLVSTGEPVHLPELLASLDGQTWKDFQVVVVDNSADDGVTPWLQATRRDVVTLRNFRDRGMARGHNQAIALALSRWAPELWRERFIALVRPETVCDPCALENLLWAFKRDPSLMVAGPKVLRAERRAVPEEDKIETARTDVIDSAGVLFTKSRQQVARGAGETDRGQYDRAPVPFSFSEAAIVVRASVFSAAKFEQEWLDEDLPEGQVMLDFLWRCHWLGFKTALVPEAKVWVHRRSQTPLQARITRHNIFLLRVKNDTWANRFAHLPWIIGQQLGFLFLALVDWRLLGAFASGLSVWPRIRRKRRELRRARRASSRDLRRLMT